jgi:hypothetical protein
VVLKISEQTIEPENSQNFAYFEVKWISGGKNWYSHYIVALSDSEV